MVIPHYLILNTGAKMPTIGFGSFLLKGNTLHSALDYALFLGYRLVDTAYLYGNEADIGQVLNDRIKAGKMKRKNVFLTTKIGKAHMRRADVLASFQKSLHDLQTTYVDSVLIHHPWSVVDTGPDGEIKFDNVDITETWAALQSLFKDGSAKSLGVSNFTAKQMDRILKCGGPPLSHLQTECHAYLAQKNLKNFCDRKHIAVTAYAPLGAAERPARLKTDSEKHLLSDPCIKEISERFRKTPAQVLLNFLLKRGMVVIPKSGSEERLKENFESSNWELSQEDFEAVLQLDCGVKYFKFLNRAGHPEFFLHEEY